MLLALCLGCKESSSPTTPAAKPGTIQVSVSGVPTFTNHTMWYSLWDSVQATGGPAGAMEGAGFFVVQNGAGSSTALDYGTQNIKTFEARKYYLFYFVDMNDNFASRNEPDAGDYAGGGSNYSITVDGNVVKQLTMQDFTIMN